MQERKSLVEQRLWGVGVGLGGQGLQSQLLRKLKQGIPKLNAIHGDFCLKMKTKKGQGPNLVVKHLWVWSPGPPKEGRVQEGGDSPRTEHRRVQMNCKIRIGKLDADHPWGKAVFPKDASGRSKKSKQIEESQRSPWAVLRLLNYRAALGQAGQALPLCLEDARKKTSELLFKQGTTSPGRLWIWKLGEMGKQSLSNWVYELRVEDKAETALLRSQPPWGSEEGSSTAAQGCESQGHPGWCVVPGGCGRPLQNGPQIVQAPLPHSF